MKVKTTMTAERKATGSVIQSVFYGTRYDFICFVGELKLNGFQITQFHEVLT